VRRLYRAPGTKISSSRARGPSGTRTGKDLLSQSLKGWPAAACVQKKEKQQQLRIIKGKKVFSRGTAVGFRRSPSAQGVGPAMWGRGKSLYFIWKKSPRRGSWCLIRKKEASIQEEHCRAHPAELSFPEKKEKTENNQPTHERKGLLFCLPMGPAVRTKTALPGSGPAPENRKGKGIHSAMGGEVCSKGKKEVSPDLGKVVERMPDLADSIHAGEATEEKVS